MKHAHIERFPQRETSCVMVTRALTKLLLAKHHGINLSSVKRIFKARTRN